MNIEIYKFPIFPFKYDKFYQVYNLRIQFLYQNAWKIFYVTKLVYVLNLYLTRNYIETEVFIGITILGVRLYLYIIKE